MSVSYPNQYRNYCVFNPNISSESKNLEEIKSSLEHAKSEDEVLEDLYILNLKLDTVKKILISYIPLYQNIIKQNRLIFKHTWQVFIEKLKFRMLLVHYGQCLYKMQLIHRKIAVLIQTKKSAEQY